MERTPKEDSNSKSWVMLVMPVMLLDSKKINHHNYPARREQPTALFRHSLGGCVRPSLHDIPKQSQNQTWGKGRQRATWENDENGWNGTWIWLNHLPWMKGQPERIGLNIDVLLNCQSQKEMELNPQKQIGELCATWFHMASHSSVLPVASVQPDEARQMKCTKHCQASNRTSGRSLRRMLPSKTCLLATQVSHGVPIVAADQSRHIKTMMHSREPGNRDKDLCF